MDTNSVISAGNLIKKYKKFELNIDELNVPEGFATALIGENGAGKTTLLNILMGVRLDYTGRIVYFDKYDDNDRENNPIVKEKIGYTSTGNYFMPHWKINDIANVSKILYKDFDENKFFKWVDALRISTDKNSRVWSLSDGNKIKLMIAAVMARDTDLLIMDEPASALDPVMRDSLKDIYRDYLMLDEGKKSILFSTHNIADMEAVTDYAIIMSGGKIVETGFIEELKEKYILVKSDEPLNDALCNYIYYLITDKYGFEAIVLVEYLDKFACEPIITETASLSQISVAVMKHFSGRR